MTQPRAYYNEFDPFAAQWLRNLIAAGHIAPGDVDERSIEDVRPDDLVGYRQCHFFAGIGVWSYALRQAGVGDDAAVWTGSCPCQPFSAAGEGKGFADERHLWPAFFHLIEQCGPAVVLGEQVAGADADPWIDLVCDDLERLGYAFGATPFPAASLGAPHIRDRLYWVAHASGSRQLSRSLGSLHRGQEGAGPRYGELERRGAVGWLAHTDEGQRGPGRARSDQADRGRPHDEPAGRNLAGGLADADGGNAGAEGLQRGRQHGQQPQDGGTRGMAITDRGRLEGADLPVRPARQEQAAAVERGVVGRSGRSPGEHDGPPGPLNGFWRAADWLCCRDGRWRPVEPGAFPLASGLAGRVGRLRAYGNAINAAQAQVFIECVMECIPVNPSELEQAR